MIALVTGGGRGIGANIARKLAEDGWEVVVAARTLAQVEAVADEIGGRAVALDVTDREAVERAVAERGRSTCSSPTPASRAADGATWEIEPEEWWRTFEVNVLGVHLCCRAVIPGMLERGSGRIVITGQRRGVLPRAGGMTPPTRRARRRSAATASRSPRELAGRIPVFFFSPGLVRTDMTSWASRGRALDAAGAAPQLVAALATGRYDALAGRYLHAEHDDLDDLLARIDEVRERDLNAIRLRR